MPRMLSSRPNPGSCASVTLVAASFLDAADVPTPKVTAMAADKPGTAGRNYPFFATDIVLANFGYVEEEFMYEGTANTYAPPGPDGNVEIAERGIPYRTRLIVRRPARQSRFNGVVIVEWFNVTNQYDTDVLWLYQKEFFIREGYAWVGVSAQNVGLSAAQTGLKVWSPDALRDARRHQRRQDHRRRARGGHLFASRDGRFAASPRCSADSSPRI